MANSQKHATEWLRFLLAQDLPFAEALRSQIDVGKVGELCNCGCQGFAFEVPDSVHAQPLQKGAGVFYEIAFASNYPEEIDILLFTDERGNLSWVDVTYGVCNIDPMPDEIMPSHKIGAWPGTRTDLPAVGATLPDSKDL